MATLKELTAPDLTQQPLGITFDAAAGNVSLKSGVIHQLPHFEGSGGDDPNKVLADLYIVCGSMKQGDTTTEQMMLRCFPFALKGAARDWLHYLPAGSIMNWT